MADKKRFIIGPEAPLIDAVAVIEENGHRSLIVVSDDGVVVGTLSDGDVRKTLLEGRLSRVPVRDVMNTHFISLRPEEAGRAKGIFESTHIFLIPVVDERLRLLDVISAY